MTNLPTVPTATQSYADRIQNDYPGEQYSWFLDMLRGRCPDVAIPFSHSHERISTIRIVDDIGTTSRSEHFVAPKGIEVRKGFVDALLRPLPRMSLRVIIVHFSRVQDLNFAYIDALGSALDIDPSFSDHAFRPLSCQAWSLVATKSPINASSGVKTSAILLR